MRFYFAPLEGITGYIYRNAYHSLFGEMDQYFTPFIVPNQHRKFSFKELQDLMPEHNQGMKVVPQILTNRAEDFIWAGQELKRIGYGVINLNLGCPSGTVVSKNKGSGFLALREELNRFLDEVFSGLDMKITVKTRIGKNSPDEFYELIEIFNRYPIAELIIHPRIRTDFYKNKPNLEVFRSALSLSKNSLCYNGDIFTVRDYRDFTAGFPAVESVMLGRGMITNPGLADEIRSGITLEKQLLMEFHDRVYQGYREVISGDRNLMFKMKELWFYLIWMFPDSDKYIKRIRKAEHQADYELAVSSLFRDLPMAAGAGYGQKAMP